MAGAVIGDAEIIHRINVFKVFITSKKNKLQNAGLRCFLGKNERFRNVGSDGAEALGGLILNWMIQNSIFLSSTILYKVG